jgi:hypothetical protein
LFYAGRGAAAHAKNSGRTAVALLLFILFLNIFPKGFILWEALSPQRIEIL